MRPWPWVLALLVAATLAVGTVGLPPHAAPDAPVHTHVGARYVADGYAETGMRNLVTAVLINYRGLDTFVEVTVIFTALVALLALPRGGPVAPVASGVPVSPVVLFVVRQLAPFLALFALAMLYRGHVSPGGGFQAAALFGALFVALGLVLGTARAARLIPRGAAPWLQAAGPLAFVFVAVLGWRLTGAFLGFPQAAEWYALREAMTLVVESGIALGGGVVLARLFLAMEA